VSHAADICDAPTSIDRIPNFGSNLPTQLMQHYLFGHGKAVYIDWAFLSNSGGFRQAATALQPGTVTNYRPPLDSTLFVALGTFTACRFSTVMYGAYDHWDFTPDKKANYPYYPLWLLRYVGAAEFPVYSAGSL
jgi:hypothetical protein